MKGRSAAVVAGVLAAILWLSGCGARLATQQACPTALLSGQLVEVDGLLSVRTDDGLVVAVDWSNYGLHREGEVVVVTDSESTALAREGDFVNLGGGFGPGSSPFKVCGQVDVVEPR